MGFGQLDSPLYGCLRENDARTDADSAKEEKAKPHTNVNGARTLAAAGKQPSFFRNPVI